MTYLDEVSALAKAWTWFRQYWMYAGFVTGLFLLALAPALAEEIGVPLLLVYLQLPIYMVHQLEEHHEDRFRRWINNVLAGGREVLSTPAVVVVNVLGVWVVDLIALYLARFVSLGLGLIAVYLTLVNAVVHIVGGAVQRRYNPGLVSAVALFLPVGIGALLVLSAVPSVRIADHVIGLAFAILLHAAILAYVRTRIAAMPPIGASGDPPSS